MRISKISSSSAFLLFAAIILHHCVILRQVLASDANDFTVLKGFADCLQSEIPGWNISDSNCCSWTGVTCDNSTSSNSRVVGLELGRSRLTGTICEALTGLDQLRILNLSNNLLHGTLPAKLFHFQYLEILDLSYNDFTGQLPASIQIPSLTSFNISRNQFSGFLNVSLCNFSSKIRVLDLSNNNFIGEASSCFQNCTSLQYLYLNGNSLSGKFPENLFILHNLRELHLQDNHFSGVLRHRISNLANLVELDISNNNFSGNLPDVFGSLKKLEHFDATLNRFTGILPNSLVNSPSLIKLALSRNFLYGQLNFNCSAMVRISTLNLGSNNFTGPIPDALSSCKTLTDFNLARNKIGSQIPHSFKNLQSLKYLSFSNTSITNISSALEILQHCRNLTILVLSKNFNQEEMPNNADFQFPSLKALIIPSCPLRGSLPVWLRSCTMLQLVDLSANFLTGSIPAWIGDFRYVFYLDLSNNSFIEEIPESLTNLQSLISDNVSIDRVFSDFPLFKGRQNGSGLQYNAIQSLPPTLDLSHNKLSGPIWPSFGGLRELHFLNLSENQLSGTIPSSLSGMKSLEILDLSYNKLSGEIPQSLVDLSFLSKFSVAFNQLYGVIPNGGQFLTFPGSSYEGNSGLCGTIYKICKGEESPPSLEAGDDDEGVQILGWNFAIGAVTGFVLSVAFCFIYPFKGRKRRKVGTRRNRHR